MVQPEAKTRRVKVVAGRLTFLSLLIGGLGFAIVGSASTLWVRAPIPALEPPAGSFAAEYDRASVAPEAINIYESAPKARYRMAPSTPMVNALAGAPGSGEVSVKWDLDWLGRGSLLGFSVQEMTSGKSMAMTAEARSVKFSGLRAGLYSFQVSAIGEYEIVTSPSSTPVTLLPIPPPVVVATACHYLVDVNLTTQSMVASACGKVYLTSLITSGMPGQRSPTGYWSVLYKRTNMTFYSPWPQGSPYYYAPMHVAYAAAFRYGWKENPGDWFLHTNPNEPNSAFGPGSQDGPYASRGCIHVPYGVMANLYGWMPIGTTVYIHY